MIEDATLVYLGIYPDIIERFDAVVEKACEEHGIDSDEEVWPYVLDSFEEVFGERAERKQFTNTLIGMMFSSLDSALHEAGVDYERTDWYADGPCSAFIIDGEEVAA